MKISVNGKEQVVKENISVLELLNLLDIKRQGIAVEVNREIVPKSTHEEHIVKENDKIEIVQMVGGG